MRIAIDWSFSTGKTTLANMLGWNKIISPEREVAERIWFNFNNHKLPEKEKYQRLLLWEVLIKEAELRHFTTDTSLQLVWAYAWYTRKTIENILNSTNYDRVFYCPIEFPIQQDWVRNSQVDYQYYIDRQIKEAYTKFWIKYITLRWDIKARLETILNNL